MNLQTIINSDLLDLSHSIDRLLSNMPWSVTELQEHKNSDILFILYKINVAIIFHKNLSSEILVNFNKKKNSYLNDSIDQNITNIKQLKNGKILCCYKDLYIYDLKSKKITSKVIKMPNFFKKEKLFDILELKDGRIIGITNKCILNIKIKDKKEENDEISQIYNIPRNWLIKNFREEYFLQYFNMYELQNNKLLIHSHSSGNHISKCGRIDGNKTFNNKIFVFDLDNFEIIHFFEKFNKDNDNYGQYNGKIFVIILKKYICLATNNSIYIYNIIDYKLLKKIKNENDYIGYIIKYDEDNIISMNKYKEEYIIIIYNLSDLNNLKYQKLGIDFIKSKESELFNELINKSMYKLNNRKIIISSNRKIYIIVIPEKFNFLPFSSSLE